MEDSKSLYVLEKGMFNARDGTALYYEIKGKGRPLLFCYGLLCRREHWVHQVEQFSKHYQVITFDYRGHQFSAKPQNDQHMSLSWCASDIEDLLSHLGLTEVVCLGHSMGVPVLTRFASHTNFKVSGLVFICGTVTNPFQNMFNSNRMDSIYKVASEFYEWAPDTMDHIWKVLTRNNRINYFLTSRLGFNSRKSKQKDVDNYIEGVNQTPFGIFNSLLKDYTRYDGKNDLPRISYPTLVIAGEADKVTPLSQQKEIAENLPNGEMQIIKEGSHNAHTDFPVDVNLLIANFLQRIKYI